MNAVREEFYFYTKGLTVGYQGIALIRDIEIHLRRGEVLTFIGPNGAGKTTVLRNIIRQLKPLDGVIVLDGKEIRQQSGRELAASLSVMLTERIRPERMTCREVVESGRYPYTGRFGKLSEQDHQVVEDAMRLVHAEDLASLDFDRISDGQRQRVMLARAICQEPEIIIMDEPTSFLDVKYKLEFLSVLQELRRKKELTVIMSLHELDLAERISDRILCVKGDHVDRFGEPEEIFKPGYIKSLFQIETGSYDEETGSMELEAAKGEAEVFVIAGGGTGKNIYRKLQRQGTAFVTGILFKNDLDYPAARALAAETIAADAFEPIPVKLQREAERKIDRCKRVVCCKNTFGSFEKANEELLAYAVAAGKTVETVTG